MIKSPSFFIKLNFLGFLLTLSYFFFLRSETITANSKTLLAVFLIQSVIYLLSLKLAFNAEGLKLWQSIFVWAVIFRIITAFGSTDEQNLLSQDIHRYLWEGIVVAAGENPYLHEPDSDNLISLRNANYDLWKQVHHRQVPAIYPPFAQFIFSLLRKDILSFRLFIITLDLLTLVILSNWLHKRQLPSGQLICYAWMPLPVIELASSAHIEGLLVFLIVLAFFIYETCQSNLSKILSASYLMLAVLSKYLAAVPLGLLYLNLLKEKRYLVLILSVCINLGLLLCFYAPFTSSPLLLFEGLITYASNWRFNASIFSLSESVLIWVSQTGILFNDSVWHISKAISLLLILASGALCYKKRLDLISASGILFFSILLCSSVVYPWYLLWYCPLLVVRDFGNLRKPMLYFCCSVLISYEVLSHPENWEVTRIFLFIEYLPIYALFLLAYLKPTISNN